MGETKQTDITEKPERAVDFKPGFLAFLMALVCGKDSGLLILENDPTVLQLANAFVLGKRGAGLKKGKRYTHDEIVKYLVEYCGESFGDIKTRQIYSNITFNSLIKQG